MGRYDHIIEVKKYDTLVEVEKFNPYHDSKGRFASASGATSFTYAPGKSRAHDLAIQREKERMAASGAAGKQKIAEAEERLKGMLRDGATVKLEGIDPEMSEPLIKSIGSVLERYPTVKDAFAGFTTDDTAEGTFANSEKVMACYNTGTKMIYLNKEYYGDRAEFEKRYNASVERKHSPEGTTLDSVVVHEMGHAIDRYVSLETMDVFKVNYGVDGVSNRLWNNDIKKSRRNGTPLTGQIMTDGLSRYATKNHAEYLAEGFAEYMTSPSPRPMAQSIGKRLETYIKKAAKK